jgi:hypothetical protein
MEERGWGYEPPPTKQPINRLYFWVAGIPIAIGVLVWLGYVLGDVRDANLRKKFAAIDDAAAHPQANPSADEQAIASNHARQETPLPSSAPGQPDPCGHSVSQGAITSACRNAIRQQLKAPATAKFPGFFSDDEHVSKSGCTTTVSSWVDAQNSFGAKPRSTTTCIYDATTGTVSASVDQN